MSRRLSLSNALRALFSSQADLARQRDEAEAELAAWGTLAVKALGPAALDMSDKELREGVSRLLFKN